MHSFYLQTTHLWRNAELKQEAVFEINLCMLDAFITTVFAVGCFYLEKRIVLCYCQGK